jgi:hypothetical protein
MSDEVLKQIAEGNGHCYRHEAKSMARELIEFRDARAAGNHPPSAVTQSHFTFGP